jgi:hypothetical protein
MISDSKLELEINIVPAKRKASKSLSINPYIVKVYKRNKALSSNLITRQIEKAKAANQGAVIYIKRMLFKSNLY